MDDKTVTIRNEFLTVEFNCFGAEATSIKDTSGREYLWCGRQDVWGRQAPFLFPICGGLKNDRYILDGKKYNLMKHGFAMRLDYEAEKVNEEKVIFRALGTEEYKAAYPFVYELYVIYELSKNNLSVTYRIENHDERTMYFSIGSHESYAYDGVIEDYAIEFEKPETLKNNIIEAPLLSGKTEIVGENVTHFPLKSEYFAKDSLVFTDVKSERLKFVDKKGRQIAEVHFPGQTNLVLWTIPENGYLCIEPWSGLPDIKGYSGKIEEKAEILSLPRGEVKEIIHDITFGE